jgi:hypothetical protein
VGGVGVAKGWGIARSGEKDMRTLLKVGELLGVRVLLELGSYCT